ncbi:MutS-related protein [Sedimentibacter sp.]|uniref:MutS family DNA mismatch repair protein n=1 Tax=Sedimentibacter sp. TaxID=1960295 RepID=UPI0028B09A23|nr:DNA mismatch repair protein MutS [Sedimentibacter sp.]
MHQKYKDEIVHREFVRKEYDRLSNIVGIFKLILAAMFAYTIYNAWINHFPMKLTILLLAEAFIFVITHIYHKKLFERVAYEKGLIDIAEKNLCRISGEWRLFDDIGEEFIDYNHSYAMDLDIVGKCSLFQFLNSTNTHYGRLRFAQDLLKPEYLHQDIKMRQEAVSELSNDYSWCSHLEYCFSKIGIDKSFPVLISELQNKNRFIKSKALRVLFDILRVITCGSIFFSIITKNRYSVLLTLILITFQLILWGVGFLKANRYVGVMREIPYKIIKYDEVIKEITNKELCSYRLKELQSIILSSKEAIHDLSKISSNISQRQNGIACLILNAVWLWDYKNAVDLDIWKQKYGDSVDGWFSSIGELESLLSLANLPRNCTGTCLPEISTRFNTIQSKGLGHPLLNNENRVCNDLDLNNNILIISGSNMSGKTTFMRTVGINMVLAQTGSYVCADRMRFSMMKVMTSMRTVDALTEGVSTFYAEIKRIKDIIDYSQVNENLLFLIDEIFRGTNSVDRLKGAEEVLQKLCKLGVCGIITTHDLEVCKLEDTYPRIKNYCFYERYSGNDIIFDYKMKNGVSKTTNAQYLLRKVGIIE